MAIVGSRKRPGKRLSKKQRTRRAMSLDMEKKVMALYTAGATNAQIAEACDLTDSSHAGKWIEVAFKNHGPSEKQRTTARRVAEARLDALWRAAFLKATGSGSDPRWAAVCVSLHDRYSKLWGTDAPIEHRHAGSTAKDAVPIAHTTTVLDRTELTGMDDEQLRQAIDIAAEAAAAAPRAAAASPPADGTGAPPAS